MNVLAFLRSVVEACSAAVEANSLLDEVQSRSDDLNREVEEIDLQRASVEVVFYMRPQPAFLGGLLDAALSLDPKDVATLLFGLAWVEGGCELNEEKQRLFGDGDLAVVFLALVDALMPPPPVKEVAPVAASVPLFAVASMARWGECMMDPVNLRRAAQLLEALPSAQHAAALERLRKLVHERDPLTLDFARLADEYELEFRPRPSGRESN
jgi:hypothetical protein